MNTSTAARPTSVLLRPASAIPSTETPIKASRIGSTIVPRPATRSYANHGKIWSVFIQRG